MVIMTCVGRRQFIKTVEQTFWEFQNIGTHTCDWSRMGDKNSSTIPTMIMNASCVHSKSEKIFTTIEINHFF
jgi:hypothetical protein